MHLRIFIMDLYALYAPCPLSSTWQLAPLARLSQSFSISPPSPSAFSSSPTHPSSLSSESSRSFAPRASSSIRTRYTDIARAPKIIPANIPHRAHHQHSFLLARQVSYQLIVRTV